MRKGIKPLHMCHDAVSWESRWLAARAPAVLALVLLVLLGSISALAAEEPVTIKLWDYHTEDQKFRKSIFNQFNKENPAIKVVYTMQVVSTYPTLIDAAIRSGTPPDIFIPGAPAILEKLLTMGELMPLEKVAPSKEELGKWMAKFAPEQQPFVEGFNVFDGKVYSWPVRSSGGHSMIYWNTKLFREAGLKGPAGGPAAPETWEDTRQFARKITELGQGKVYGFVLAKKGESVIGAWDWDLFYSLAPAGGYVTFSGLDMRTGHFDFHHPGLRGAIQLWLDLRNDGSLFPGNLSMDDEQAKFRFSQNLAGMMITGYWLPGNLAALNPDMEYDVALPPTPKRGERKGGIGTGPLAGNSEYCVSSRTKRPDLVWKVITFMTSQVYQEGWVKAGGGISVFPEYNKSELFLNPALAKIAQMGAEGLRAVPDKLWSVNMRKVWPLMFESRPTYWEVMEGMWAGRWGWEAWDEVEKRWDKRFDEALAEINKTEGLQLTRADYTFPDYDPTQLFGRSSSKK